jgi:hypothetical protein
VRGFIDDHGAEEVAFDMECIHKALKHNYFDATEVMISEYFALEPQRASQAESTARNAIEQIRNRQNGLLDRFEQIPKNIPTLTPAFQWAQNTE